MGRRKRQRRPRRKLKKRNHQGRNDPLFSAATGCPGCCAFLFQVVFLLLQEKTTGRKNAELVGRSPVPFGSTRVPCRLFRLTWMLPARREVVRGGVQRLVNAELDGGTDLYADGRRFREIAQVRRWIAAAGVVVSEVHVPLVERELVELIVRLRNGL